MEQGLIEGLEKVLQSGDCIGQIRILQDLFGREQMPVSVLAPHSVAELRALRDDLISAPDASGSPGTSYNPPRPRFSRLPPRSSPERRRTCFLNALSQRSRCQASGIGVKYWHEDEDRSADASCG